MRNSVTELSKFRKNLIEMARKEMPFNNSGLLSEVEEEILSAKSDKAAERVFQRKLTYAISTFGKSGMGGY